MTNLIKITTVVFAGLMFTACSTVQGPSQFGVSQNASPLPATVVQCTTEKGKTDMDCIGGITAGANADEQRNNAVMAGFATQTECLRFYTQSYNPIAVSARQEGVNAIAACASMAIMPGRIATPVS